MWFPRPSLWRRRSALRPITRDLRRKRNRRGRSCVLVRGRRGPVYLCHNAASACPGGQRARHGAYGSTCGGIMSLSCCRTLAIDPIFRPACCAETPCCRIFRPGRAGSCAGRARRAFRVPSWCRPVRSRGCAPHVHDLRCTHGREDRSPYRCLFIGAFTCLGCDAHRSAPPCDGIHVGSVMMRRRGLLVVTYRPVGTSTLDARSTGGFPVRGV